MGAPSLPPDLPLSEATTCILLSLVPSPKHGYAILQEVRALSQGRVQLSTGTLYGALKRFLEVGWVVRVDAPTHPATRGAKVYRLTDQGHRILAAEMARLEALLVAARARQVEYQV